MNKIAIVGVCALGSAIIGTVLYFKKQKVSKPADAQEPNQSFKPTQEQVKPKKATWLKPNEKDLEFNSENFHYMVSRVPQTKADYFTHCYLYVKRTLATSMTQEDFTFHFQEFFVRFAYAVDVKKKRTPGHYELLGDSARILKEGLYSMLDKPSTLYLECVRGIEAALINGEGLEIFTKTCREFEVQSVAV